MESFDMDIYGLLIWLVPFGSPIFDSLNVIESVLLLMSVSTCNTVIQILNVAKYPE